MPITAGLSQTVSTATTSTTTSATVNPLTPVALINLILADVNAVLPNFNGLVSSYRLLVGSAEEIHRTPEVCHDVFERAVLRYDNAGLLIDVLLELLCCKIVFSSELLQVTCGPVDLVRYLLTCLDGEDTPCRSAEAVVGLEALKRLQAKFCENHYCFPDHQVVCPESPVEPSPPAPTPPPAPPAVPIICESDIADIIETKLIGILNKYGVLDNPRVPETEMSEIDENGLLRADYKQELHSGDDSELEREADLGYISRLHPKHKPGTAAKKKKDH